MDAVVSRPERERLPSTTTIGAKIKYVNIYIPIFYFLFSIEVRK